MRDYAELVKDLRNFYVNYDSHKLTNDAADAIEELLAKIDELWTQLHVEGRSLIDDYPRWISVYDQRRD